MRGRWCSTEGKGMQAWSLLYRTQFGDRGHLPLHKANIHADTEAQVLAHIHPQHHTVVLLPRPPCASAVHRLRRARTRCWTNSTTNCRGHTLRSSNSSAWESIKEEDGGRARVVAGSRNGLGSTAMFGGEIGVFSMVVQRAMVCAVESSTAI